MLSDGTARVASQSNGETVYHIVNGHCDCKDYPNAPHGFCKHRLAHAIAKRAYPLAKAKGEAAHTERLTLDLDPEVLAQPVATAQGVPPQHVVLIQGKRALHTQHDTK